MKALIGDVVYICVSFVLVFTPRCTADNIIDYYENLLSDLIESALVYEGPEDARIYEAEDDTLRDYGDFDFVIIGAGSTGTVIANRLSEVLKWKVLLLEAGKFADNVTYIPKIRYALRFTDWNWNYKTIPQKTACLASIHEECPIIRGRGVGGSTLINGLFYSRGNPIDNDRWAELVDDNTWAYQNVLKYYKKSEDLHQTDPLAPINRKYHSTGGAWNVENNLPRNKLTELFLDANAELGYNMTDYNSPEQIGASIVQYNTRRGRRDDHGTAFILPILCRKNLEVLTEAYVTKIEIDATKTATSVLFTNQGKTYRVNAKKEVILSAGAISSPHLLMLSGIGPKEHLKNFSIPIISDLPVGSALRDHVFPAGIQFSSNISTVNETLREQIIDYLNGFGTLATTASPHWLAFYKTSVETIPNYPDIEILVEFAGTASKFGKKLTQLKDEAWDALLSNSKNNTIAIGISLVHTYSIGSVRLKSSDPFDYPLIDSNLLSDRDNKDIDALYEGLNFVLKLMNTTVFQDVGAVLQGEPLPSCSHYTYLTKSYWYCFLRQMAQTSLHPVGTCLSGTDPSKGAVVDSNLKVFGINRLRVADASVFPITSTGHPSASCTMIGEKISDVIKAEY